MDERPVFADPWWDLCVGDPAECEQREALRTELLAEVAPGHTLHRQEVVVAAKSEASDDVVVELAGGRWALVHLTWTGARATPPRPLTKFFDTVAELERHLHDQKSGPND